MPVTRRPPGSRARFLPPSPLTTTRARCPACRASLAHALGRTRFHHSQSWAGNLGLAVWREPYAVVGMVRAAVWAPDQMRAMPARPRREALRTDRTAAVLLPPQTTQRPSALPMGGP